MKALFISLAILIFGYLSIYNLARMVPVWRTNSKCERVSIECKRLRMSTCQLSDNDSWGNPLQLIVVRSEAAIIYGVMSAGRDGIHSNEDDIVKESIDLNKSKIVGKWLGVKSKELLTGVKEGWAEKSIFGDSDNE